MPCLSTGRVTSFSLGCEIRTGGASVGRIQPSYSTRRRIFHLKTIVVIAITKSFTRPLPVGHFIMPCDERTGLTEPCVAKCDWKVAINYDDIKVRLGFTPPDLWDQIVAEILHQQTMKRHDR